MRNLLALTLLALFAPLAAEAQYDARSKKALWDIDARIDELGYNPDHGMGVAASVILRDYPGADKLQPLDNRHWFELHGAIYSEWRRELDFRYDFNQIRWSGVHLSAGAHYMADPMAGFHGFGGASSPYYRELDRRGGMAFYGIRRDVARASVELDGNVADWGYGRKFGGNIDWNASASLADYKIGNVTYKKYADGADNSLYNLYRKYGIISDAEAAGGRRAEFSVGLTYRGYRIPIRNRASYVSAEVGVRVSPDLFDRRADYAKLSAKLSHKITLVRMAMVKDRLGLTYRLGYDGTVWSQGTVPFYVQSELGGKGTLRGVLAERVVGDGVAWGSVDVDVCVAWFAALGKVWFVSFNTFVDAGAVVQPFRTDAMRAVWNDTWRPASERRLVYSGVDEKLHTTAGLGVNIDVGRFDISATWGKPFARQDGPGAVYAGVKWAF